MPKEKSNYKKYTDIIFNETNKVIDWSNKEKMKEAGKVLFNKIFDLEGPKKISKKPTEKSIFVFNIMFKPFGEIIETLDTIKNISIYISSFPYNSDKISRVNFLKYQIGNYLVELVILQKRLTNYLVIVERGYKKSNNHTIIKMAFKQLREYIEVNFKSIFDIRGQHIHKQRYSNSKLSRLTSIEILTIREDENKKRADFLQNYFITEYKKVRKEWKIRFKEEIKSIESIFENYFDVLLTLLTDKEEIIYPSNYKWN